MKRVHYAILTGQTLSYALIIVFIFADASFNLTGILRADSITISPRFAYVAACLVGLVGCINVWLTWHYVQKAKTMRDWLVVCAWTHRIKHHGRWLTLEEFLSEQHGYEISHGLSEPALLNLRNEADTKWRQFPVPDAPDQVAATIAPSAPAAETSG